MNNRGFSISPIKEARSNTIQKVGSLMSEIVNKMKIECEKARYINFQNQQTNCVNQHKTTKALISESLYLYKFINYFN